MSREELEAQFQSLCLQGGVNHDFFPTSGNSQNSMAVQQGLQISELHSHFPSEAKLWVKEVEMVDSVVDFKSSRSIAGKNFPNLELLDARIASALNNIIQKSNFKKKESPLHARFFDSCWMTLSECVIFIVFVKAASFAQMFFYFFLGRRMQ